MSKKNRIRRLPKGWRNSFATRRDRSAFRQSAKRDLLLVQVPNLGEGLQAHRLEKLNRYETHMDRKFERTLAMLLKLKELRRI